MDNDSDNDDILNDLLSNSAEEIEQPAPKKTLKELDFNFLDDVGEKDTVTEPPKNQKESEVSADLLDSSDDEDRRNFEEQKYSDYGREIKSLLKNDPADKVGSKDASFKKSSKTFDFNSTPRNSQVGSPKSIQTTKDVYSDPFFGLRIVSPLVSSTELKSRMDGKNAVTIAKVKYHVTSERVDNDWVIAGVLISKSAPKTSQKGSSYSIWKLSDLSDNMNTISLFMFSTAYKTLWKTIVGTVLGVLNPNVLESKDNIDQATLSVDNPQKVMILGKSKDMGKCKSVKKNGDACTSIVNLSRCEYCVYHVKQEYKKCSRRAELQSTSSPQAFSLDVLNRKQQQQQRRPFGNSMPGFVADYAVPNKKLEAKDAERLALLSGSSKKVVAKDAERLALLSGSSKKIDKPENKKVTDEAGRNKISIDLTSQQVKKDYDRLNKLRGWKPAMSVITPSSTKNTESPSSSHKAASLKQINMDAKALNLAALSAKPHLGVGCVGGTIDFSEPITKTHISRAKRNAIKWVQDNGKLKCKNPNKVGLDKEEKIERGMKRSREEEESEVQEAKKPNVLSDKFQELLRAKSAHTDLIEKSYEEEKDKYFNKLELKERMEEKMLTTFKVQCKAVRCLICKYTAFSASDMCKEQRHPLRVTDAVKRFFKCADCGNRTVSLDRIPAQNCSKCSGAHWTKTAMMDERKTNVSVVPLSVRGDEEGHIGGQIKDANLNLLVPESN